MGAAKFPKRGDSGGGGGLPEFNWAVVDIWSAGHPARGPRSDVDLADLPYAQSPFEASSTANPSPLVGSLPAFRSQLEGLTPRHREPAVTTVFRTGPPKRHTAKRPEGTPPTSTTQATHT